MGAFDTMGRVDPATRPPAATQSQGKHSIHALWVSAGLLYLVGSLACGVVYLTILVENLANDFWWRQFNTTGGQTFLADVFNARLSQGLHGNATAVDLFTNEFAATGKDYSTSLTFVDMRETSARQWMLQPLPLDMAVTTIRANSLYENVYTVIPYCWVDLGRQFEMAHTAIRQQRCLKRFTANAAMYLETLLRNTAQIDLTQSNFGTQVNQTILTPVTTLPNGQAWVAALCANKWLAVDDEVKLWQQSGIVYYAIQYQNRFQYGIEDKLTIVNALGIAQRIKISSIPYLYLGLATWTTISIHSGIWNDMMFAIQYKASLVHHTTNYFETLGYDWDLVKNGPVRTVGIKLVRSTLGPIRTIDADLILPPPSLVAYVNAFRVKFLDATKSSNLSKPALPVSGILIDVLPPSWSGSSMAYYGGNPLCFTFANSLPYPQMPFSFYDACQTQIPFAIKFDQSNALFAAASMQVPAQAVCQMSPKSQNTCIGVLQLVLATLQQMDTVTAFCQLIQQSIQDILPLQIEFIQMATRNNTNVFLSQPIIDPSNTDAWSFFGWLTLYDWVDGEREVLYLEGDVGNRTLMSDRIEYLNFAASALELPRNACVYFWYLTVYVTIASGIVSTLILLYAILNRFNINGPNLFLFNRVFGSVWIGRPILFLRGITAVVVLSTSTATLSQEYGVTYFLNYKVSWIRSLIVSGETLWIQYVISDILIPFTGHFTREYSRLSSAMSFLCVFLIDRTNPFQVQALMQRTCTVASFRRGIACTSGLVEIGSIQRVGLLIGIQLGSSLLSYMLVRQYYRWAVAKEESQHNILIPAVTTVYLNHGTGKHWGTWDLDSAACIMSGILPLSKYSIDLKTWVSIESKTLMGHSSFTQAHFKLKPSGLELAPVFRTRHAWLGVLSFVYMAGSIASSYAFIVLTKSSMSNDFWWASFDSNTQTFLSNWFNANLQTTNTWRGVELASSDQGVLTTTANQTVTLVNIAPVYANMVQDEANSLANVIQSLRQMDGCTLPWIMTSYCYVDFNRQWEMAVTAKKLQRCEQDQSNAAVYLESILRNAMWSTLSQCWGLALETAIFSFLKTTTTGAQWVTSTSTNTNSVSDEVQVWHSANILTFRTEWQNYKSLGVIETFSVENAFGWKYPLTLKYSNSSSQLAVQTSFKMQWPLANHLSRLITNSSSQLGMSLIRASPKFAYTNQTPENALTQAGFLSSPLGPGFTIVKNVLGPFGVIAMKRITCPHSLQSLYLNLTLYTSRLLSSSSAVQDAFWAIYTAYTIQPTWKAWDSIQQRGGSILCELDQVVRGLQDRPGMFFTPKGSCGLGLLESLTGDTSGMMKAILGLPSVNISAAALRERNNPVSTKTFLENTWNFVQTYVPATQRQQLQAQAHQTKMDIRDNLQVSITQFYYTGNAYALSVINYFDPTEPDLELYAWLFMFDWVQGTREVVSFQGDNGTITALSTTATYIQMAVNPMEVPLNVANYMRWFLQYITWVMLGVASLVCVYIALEHGQIEASNMTSFSRVTSLVWIGRPLILLRALSAVCLLATSTLRLTLPFEGLVSYFESVPQPWYMIVLTASELNWLVYIINDVFSLATKKYTRRYSILSFNLVWILSAIWAFTAPPKRMVTIDRVCTVIQVDFQVVCNGGTVAIGSVSQFYSLLALVVGCCAVCFVVEWIGYHYLNSNSKSPTSYFLYAAAKHQFRTSKWDYQGVQYIDKASAVLTGILSLRLQRELLIFDIKTWRIYAIPIIQLGLDDINLPQHLAKAIPLVE
ncbi:Aste57867_610 [Aphanomyces stellatus]|uniref:Aste57867_610 protein n=1 Tax=Aphanomyces stellatus TaxID=120398 RepID=A0A485K3D4_9STRA|nr:hypothetical protein As57867_000609 [Aphanomyces stellatus]VFT77835.1 Aste57867_610 [Aphanomyces stellatus]